MKTVSDLIPWRRRRQERCDRPLASVLCLLLCVFVTHGAGLAAPAVVHQFEGLSNEDNVALIGARVNPPDNGLAVGPAHVVEMVNFVGRVTDKAGNVLSGFSLSSFFSADPGSRVGDPRVMYDTGSGRWYATSMNISEALRSSSIILAVSATSDPTGSFCLYRLGNLTSERFVQDYPSLGITNDKIVVSYDAFDFSTGVLLGGGFYVINKAQTLACATAARVRFPPVFGVQLKPAHALSSTSTAYMVGHTATSVTVRSIDGVPDGVPVTLSDTSIPMRNVWGEPPQAVQRGSSDLLDIDRRTQTVFWSNDSLWLGGNGDCIPAGDTATRSCLRLVEVRTDSMTVRQEILWGAAGRYYFHPAVRPDASGNVFVVFMASSASEFPGVRAAGRLSADPLNTLQPSILLRAGEGPATSSLGAHTEHDTRIGDYSGAAVDPTDPLTVWVSSEYVKETGDWGTYVAALSFTDRVATFVTGLYQNALGRTPTASEVDVWVQYLRANPNLAAASTVIHLFFDGPEYRNRPVTPWESVTFLYRAILGRDPDPQGQAGWATVILSRFDTLLPAFVNSQEFKTLVAQSAPASTVTRFYQVLLGRTPSAAEITGWATFLVAEGDIGVVASAFLNSIEYLATPRTLDQHVTLLYRALLGRLPGPGETTPWVSDLAGQLAIVVDAFVNSPEFRARLPALF